MNVLVLHEAEGGGVGSLVHLLKNWGSLDDGFFSGRVTGEVVPTHPDETQSTVLADALNDWKQWDYF